jgi:hypothetical protein
MGRIGEHAMAAHQTLLPTRLGCASNPSTAHNCSPKLRGDAYGRAAPPPLDSACEQDADLVQDHQWEHHG